MTDHLNLSHEKGLKSTYRVDRKSWCLKNTVATSF